MNWNGDYNNCDDYHAIHLNQPQALRSPQVSLDFYSGSSECARPPSPSTRNTALDSQAMPPTSESLNWSMLSSTNYGNVFSTGFSSPTPEIGPNYSPETTEGLFSHTASTSPGGQVMSLPGQTRQTLEQKDCNNEVYNQALKTGKHARTQAIGKRTKRSQQYVSSNLFASIVTNDSPSSSTDREIPHWRNPLSANGMVATTPVHSNMSLY